MNRSSKGQTGSIEEIWFKTEPVDDESNGYFSIKSEDDKSPPTISTDSTPDEESFEITFVDFECTPQTDVVEISNDEKSIGTLDDNDVTVVEYDSNILIETAEQMTRTVERCFSCDECWKKFARKDSLNRHKMFHSRLKLLECEECGLKFAQKCHLEEHRVTHKNVNMLPCDKCGATFVTKRILQLHQGTHRETSQTSNMFACKECGKEYIRKSSLNIHMRSHTGVRPFPCDECGKQFSRKGYLTSHLRRHREHWEIGTYTHELQIEFVE